MVDEIAELSHDDREELKGTLDDLVRDGARMEFASARFKRILGKVSADSFAAMRHCAVEILDLRARKYIFGC
jgi:hypothetical protein